MSMIGEQINELKKAAKWFEGACFPEGVKLAEEAADTIEALSAKLADMERSAENYGGGWIYCGDGENMPEERTDVLVSFEGNHNPLVAWYSSINNHWKNSCTDNAIRAKVIAWQPLPEPYHEP